MAVNGKHGITQATPENILLGAGTYHKNFVWNSNGWKGDIVGATSGGGKVTIKGELVDLELDGALVKFKGQTVMQGGTASMEVNYAEITADILKSVLIAENVESDAEGYNCLQVKSKIEEGDYLDNFAFVGKTANGGKDIIVIFESALCTSGLELEPKMKEQSVIKATIEAYAEVDGDLDTIPVKIYYPTTDMPM